jgi:FkbM family methyltransferase
MNEAVADRTRGGLVKRWVELPQFKICVSAADYLISEGVARNRRYEPYITAILNEHLFPGQSFLDLGANIGYHTLTAATIVGPTGRCTAVEMSPDNCELLRDSVAANGYSHVRVVNCAASDSPGTIDFTLGGRETTNGVLVTDAIRPHVGNDWYSEARTVEARPVDALFSEKDRVDLIKMDIEGSELIAWKGMRRLIERCRPKITFEYFPDLLRMVSGCQPIELLRAIQSFGYRLHVIDEVGRTSVVSGEEATAKADTGKPGSLIDLLALPM